MGKCSSRPWVFPVSVSALLSLTPGLRATSIGPGSIESDNILVQDGNVVFVQPGGGLTVLDAATGTVRLRTLPPNSSERHYELIRTKAGVLVSAWHASRMVDLARPAVSWTLEGCDGRFHLAPEGLICVSGERSMFSTRVRFALHRLTDGKALWTYRTSEAFGGEVLDGRGRMMLTFEDLSEKETLEAGRGTLTQPVRRVVGLTVIDLSSGRELLPRTTQDVKLDGNARQPIHFDGERITYLLRRGADDSCRGQRQRILTLNMVASAYATEERCEPPPKEGPNLPTSSVYIPAGPADRRTRHLTGASVTLGTIGDATLVDVTSGGRRWLAGIPSDLRLVPQLGLIRADGDLLFLESESWEAGRLDAFDAKAGRPLWTYLFSTDWREIRSHPPGGAFSVPLEALGKERGTPSGRPFQPKAAVRVVLDPGPSGPATP